MIGKKVKNPWKKLMANVMLSSKYGAIGGRTHKNNPKLRRKLNTSQSTKRHSVEITWQDLKHQFEKQKGKCYWLGIKMNPQEIFIPHNPISISVDRLHNELGYTVDNIVICCRFINLGRRNCPIQKFKKIINNIKEEFLRKGEKRFYRDLMKD